MNTTTRKFSSQPSKELFQLVQSLTKGQHMGFRQQLTPKRQSLYDLLRSMETYDPKAIQQAFPDDSRNNLHATKVALLDQLTRYLYLSEPENGVRNLQFLVGEAQKLHRLGRGALALTRINAAIAAAIDLELGDVLIKAVELRSAVMASLPTDVADSLDYDQLVRTAMQEAVLQLRLDELLLDAHAVREQAAQGQHLLLQDLAARLDALPWPRYCRNQVKFYRLKFFCARMAQEETQSMAAARTIVKLLEERPALMDDHDLRQEYFGKLNYLAVLMAGQKRIDEANAVLSAIHAALSRWADKIEGNEECYASCFYSQLAIQIASGDWAACKEMVVLIMKRFVQEHQNLAVSVRPSLLLLAAYAAFLIRDFSAARRFVRAFRASYQDYRVKRSTLVFAGTVLLLSYIEELDEFLPKAHKDIAAWFLSEGLQGAYEQNILDFVQGVCRENQGNTHTSPLDQLDLTMRELACIPDAKPYIEMFPIFEWIRSQRNGQDIRELLIG